MKANNNKKRKIPQTSTICKSIDLAFLKCFLDLKYILWLIPITVIVFLVQMAGGEGSTAVDKVIK